MSLNSISNELINQQRSTAEASTTLEMETGSDESTGNSGTDQAVSALTQFIPTEVLAPYVAALSLTASGSIQWNASHFYWVFVFVTPVMFLLFHFARIASDESQPWPTVRDWPFLGWKAVAASIAFAVWALAVPTNQLQGLIGGAAVAGFLAIVISPLLTAVDKILERLLKRHA